MTADKTFQLQSAALGAGMLFAVAELALDAYDAAQGGAPSRVILHGVTALALFILCAWLRRMHRANDAKAPPLRLDLPLEQLRLLLDNIPDRIWVKDTGGCYILMNRAEAEACGAERGELIGKVAADMRLSPEQTARVNSEDRQVIQSGIPLHLERTSHVTGNWLDLRKLPFTAVDGSVGGLLCIARDLTESRRIAATQARLTALSEHRSIALFERTLDNVVVSWSSGAEAMLGFTAAQVVGKPVTFMTPSEDTARLTRNNERLAQGLSISYEGRRVTADGRVIDVLISQASITDAAGKLQGASVIFQDITALKLARTSAVEGEARYRSLFESSPMPVVLWSPASARITDVNAAAVRVFDFVDDEFMGLPLADLVKQGDEESRAAINAVVEGRDTGMTQNLTLVNRQGATVHLEMVTSVNRAPSGSECISVFSDVSETRRSADTMREARGFLLQVLDSYPDMIAVADNERRVMFVNRRAAEFIGMPYDQCVALLNGNGDMDSHALALRLFDCARVLARGERMDEEIEAPGADGAVRWYEVIRVPLVNAQGTAGAIAIVGDVTQLKQSTETIRRLNTELELRVAERTAQLMAANRELEAFASSVSHDLRAPLRGIDGFSLMLIEEFSAELPERARDYLHRVRVASRRMGEQIEGMLALSRVARIDINMMPMDLTAAAEDIAGELRLEHAGQVIDIRVAPGMQAVGDPRLLRIALENLLRNAVKFSGKRADARIEFSAALSEDETVYCIRDNGVGFDMAYADKLFGAFKRLHTEREFPGTGVGLATVQRVIHRHGGRVWAQGAVGQGATFYFTLNTPVAVNVAA